MPRFLGAEDAVGGRARRAGEPSDVFLCERDEGVGRGFAVELHQLAESPEDPGLGRYEERLEQAVARASEARCEQANEHLVHLRVLAAHSAEVVPVDRKRLAGFHGCDRSRARGARVHESELAECLAGTVDRDRQRVELRGDAGCKASLHDQMEAVGRISPMEDDLTTVEPASPGDRYERRSSASGKPPKSWLSVTGEVSPSSHAECHAHDKAGREHAALRSSRYQAMHGG